MDKRAYLRKLDLHNPWHLMATGFGSGFCPKAPGTAGSFAAMFLCMLLVYVPWYVQLAVIALTFVLGTIACSKAEQAMGIHDHGGIVIDEFAGMFIAVFCFAPYWQLALAAFVFFRFFDILKPFPVSWADEKIPGGLGIMLDDVLAGIYACLCAHLAGWLLSSVAGITPAQLFG